MSDVEVEERAPSPDSQCRICLGGIKSKSFADSCSHYFCFSCLVQWSKVKAECPLCKRPFKCIFHNIRSTAEYDKYVVPVVPPESGRMNSRNPTILLPDIMTYSVYVSVFQSEETVRGYFFDGIEYTDHYITPSPRQVRMRANLSANLRNPRARSRSNHFRADIYRQGRYVNRLTEPGGPSRECTPIFYRENPSQLGRLRPWVKRELSVFVSPRLASQMTEDLLSMLKEKHVDSLEFQTWLLPRLGDRVAHFIHELKAFATSYYDMAGFDENAQYDISSSPIRSLTRRRNRRTGPNNAVSVPVVELVDLEQDGQFESIDLRSDSGSEIELIEPAPRPVPQVTISSGDEDEQVNADSRRPARMHARNEVIATSSDASSLSVKTERVIDPDYKPPATGCRLVSPIPSTSRGRGNRSRDLSCSSSSSELHVSKKRRKSKHRREADVKKRRSKRCVSPSSSSDSDAVDKKHSKQSKSKRRAIKKVSSKKHVPSSNSSDSNSR